MPHALWRGAVYDLHHAFLLVCADLHLQSGMRYYSCASATVLGVAAMAGRGITTVAGGLASLASIFEYGVCEYIVRTPLYTTQMRERLSNGVPRWR